MTTLDAHLACFRLLTLTGGGTVADEDGMLRYAGTHPLPFVVNAASRTDRGVAPKAALTATIDFFGSLGRGGELTCLEGRDDDILAAPQEARLPVGTPDPLQTIDDRPRRSLADPTSVEVRVVNDAAGVVDLIRVCADGHASYPLPDDLFPRLFANPDTVLSPDIYAVVAYDDDGAVATAQVFMHREVAYVGWVSTVRRAMRRGLGWLITEIVTVEGFERGATMAGLLASPMGAPLYRKMGFQDVASLRGVAIRP